MECYFLDIEQGFIRKNEIGSDLSLLKRDDPLWFHEHKNDQTQIQALFSHLGIDQDIMHFIRFGGKRTKCLVKKDCIVFHIFFNRLSQKKSKLHSEDQHIVIVLSRNWIVSSSEDWNLFEQNEIIQKISLSNKQEPYFSILNLLLDYFVESFLPLIETYTEHIEILEEKAVSSPTAPTFQSIHGLKKQVLETKKSLFYLQEAIRSFLDEIEDKMSPQTQKLIEQRFELVSHYHALSDALLENLNGVIDLYFSSQGSKLNEIMKTLTIVATIFAPLSFLTGVYSITYYPNSSPWNVLRLNEEWGFFVFSAVSALIAYGMYRFFKRKGWLNKEDLSLPQFSVLKKNKKTNRLRDETRS